MIAERALAIVSHGVLIGGLVCHALGPSLEAHWRVRRDVAGVTCLDWFGSRVVLSLLKDTCHLRGWERVRSHYQTVGPGRWTPERSND